MVRSKVYRSILPVDDEHDKLLRDVDLPGLRVLVFTFVVDAFSQDTDDVVTFGRFKEF